jgi:hypothetical protein
MQLSRSCHAFFQAPDSSQTDLDEIAVFFIHAQSEILLSKNDDNFDNMSGIWTRPRRALAHALDEIGVLTMWRSAGDVKLLCAQRFVRLFAYGGSTLVLASYLSAVGIADDWIGLFMTLTLVGDVVISFFLTLFADAMGRKAVLALGSALMAASGLVFALSGNYWVLLAAAVFGVISPRYAPLLVGGVVDEGSGQLIRAQWE